MSAEPPPAAGAGAPAASPGAPAAGPEAMRAQLRGYVAALHHAYLGAAALLPPGERAALPLLRAGEVTVVVAAARHLHLIATADPLPAPRGQEVAEPDAELDLAWVVRFYDPVVLPPLAVIDESAGPAAGDVRRVLGITDVIYHLSVSPGGGLTPHHAQHAGTGLANQHAAACRDADTLRAALRGREELVDEFAVAERLGLHHAVRLLAAQLAPGDPDVAGAIAGAADGDGDAAIRRALVTWARAARSGPARSGPATTGPARSGSASTGPATTARPAS